MKTAGLENIVAEQVVLGAILQSADSFWRVADVLQPNHFARAIHQTIFGAIKDLLTEGKKHTLGLIEARIGSEYDDGKSTSGYLSALVRDAEEQSAALDSVDDIVDLWRQRKMIELFEHALKEAKKEHGRSPDLITDIGLRLEDIAINSQAEPIKWLGDLASKVMTRSAVTQQGGKTPGFDTGLPSLDSILGRIHGGDLGVVAASQGDGKTLMAAQIAMHAQEYGPVAFFQLEMKAEDMASRALAGRSGSSVAEIEAGSYDAFAYEQLLVAQESLRTSKIIIDDRSKLTIEQIRDRCLAIKRRHGLILCVVDHLRHVRTSVRTKDKWERAEIVSGEAKAMAKELDIAVIMLSQVSRSSQRREDPAPQIADLDGGGPLEQDMDWGLSLFRRDRWLKNQRPRDDESKEYAIWSREMAACRGLIEVRSLKRRRGEDGEKRDFTFNGRAGRLEEL